MATIKSYTDLSQSNKLAEILPLESADMSYSFNFDSEIYEISTTSYKSWVVPKYAQPDNGFGQVIPCWSLAALLGVLPKIQGGKPVISLDDNYITYPHMSDLHTKAGNLVDACYEMIIKLHELNLF